MTKAPWRGMGRMGTQAVAVGRARKGASRSIERSDRLAGDMKRKGNTIPRRSILHELSGACGDLGTFIPHAIGAMTVAGLAPTGVLLGFGIFLTATGLFYGLPLPVQPMKAVSAVILTGGLRAGEVAAAGMMPGLVLLVLGLTGWIGRLARAIPQSVSVGLQLGLGLLMGVLGLKLMLQTPWIGIASLAALVVLARIPRCPAAPLVLAAASVAGWASGGINPATEIGFFGASIPHFIVPTWSEVWRSLEVAVLPQLSLTVTNAVIVTASLSRQLFPTASTASERNLALSSGLANVLLCPFGALPMCHGAEACRPSTVLARAPDWPRSSWALRYCYLLLGSLTMPQSCLP